MDYVLDGRVTAGGKGIAYFRDQFLPAYSADLANALDDDDKVSAWLGGYEGASAV